MILNIIEELIVAIVLSIITGISIKLLDKTKRYGLFRRKSKFFGVNKKQTILIVMNHHPRRRHTMAHQDILTIVDVSKLVHDLGGIEKVTAYDEEPGPPGKTTEFCIGGPDSNDRTKAHISEFLSKIKNIPYSNEKDGLTIIVGNNKYRYEKEKKAYVILAKFFSKLNSNPTFLISGQTSLSNRAALYYLIKNYKELHKKYSSSRQFCLILKISNFREYGYETVKLVDDVTNLTFY